MAKSENRKLVALSAKQLSSKSSLEVELLKRVTVFDAPTRPLELIAHQHFARLAELFQLLAAPLVAQCCGEIGSVDGINGSGSD